MFLFLKFHPLANGTAFFLEIDQKMNLASLPVGGSQEKGGKQTKRFNKWSIGERERDLGEEKSEGERGRERILQSHSPGSGMNC